MSHGTGTTREEDTTQNHTRKAGAETAGAETAGAETTPRTGGTTERQTLGVGYKLALPVEEHRRRHAGTREENSEVVEPQRGWVGLSSPIPYPTRRSQATCPKDHNHTPPVRDCVCGYMAARRAAHLEATGEPVGEAFLLGVIALGDVLEYEHGWRAGGHKITAAAAPRLCPRCRNGETAGAGWWGETRYGLDVETRILSPGCGACLVQAVTKYTLDELSKNWGVRSGLWDPTPGPSGGGTARDGVGARLWDRLSQQSKKALLWVAAALFGKRR